MRLRSRLCAAVVILAVMFTGGRARALEVLVEHPREGAGYVWADLRVQDVFPPRVEQSLERGMPATLLLHTELWRRRSGWFDRMENTFESAIKIRLEVWEDRYLIQRPGSATIAVGTLDSVRAILSRPMSIAVGRIGAVRPEALYYLVVSVTLKPLTVEDLEEGEGWLSGEVESKRRSGFGVITGLPRSVFDAVRNFAGFGDERARAISNDFDLASLFARE